MRVLLLLLACTSSCMAVQLQNFKKLRRQEQLQAVSLAAVSNGLASLKSDKWGFKDCDTSHDCDYDNFCKLTVDDLGKYQTNCKPCDICIHADEIDGDCHNSCLMSAGLCEDHYDCRSWKDEFGRTQEGGMFCGVKRDEEGKATNSFSCQLCEKCKVKSDGVDGSCGPECRGQPTFCMNADDCGPGHFCMRTTKRKKNGDGVLGGFPLLDITGNKCKPCSQLTYIQVSSDLSTAARQMLDEKCPNGPTQCDEKHPCSEGRICTPDWDTRLPGKCRMEKTEGQPTPTPAH